MQEWKRPPRVDEPLLTELRAGVLTPRFRMALLRQAVTLAGVFILGWPALEIAVFFLLEAFLFLSLRAAVEISLDPHYGVAARTPLAMAGQIAIHWLVAVPVIGIVIIAFGGFAVLPAFPADAWGLFLREGVRDPSFLGALAILTGSIVHDAARFAARIARGRGPGEKAKDDDGIRLALGKVFFLAMASFWMGLAARLGLGPQAVAVGVAGALLYAEAVPHRARRMFEPKPK